MRIGSIIIVGTESQLAHAGNRLRLERHIPINDSPSRRIENGRTLFFMRDVLFIIIERQRASQPIRIRPFAPPVAGPAPVWAEASDVIR